MIMLLSLALLGALLLGPIAFFRSRALMRDLEIALQRVAGLERRIASLESAGPTVSPAPEEAEQTDEPEPIDDGGAQPIPPATGWLAAAAATASVPPVPQATGPGLEERLGTRWAVWVGGAALAFGALLLVRYSIERGFFGPGVRTIAGALFALALLTVGERLRREEGRSEPVSWTERPPVSAILTAAGTIAAFATIWAAHALYGFIGAALAMVLLGATGVAAMLAAALHGPALAGLGLVGALATPLLVTSRDPNAWPVVLYVAVVAATAYGLARLRVWLWLAFSAAAGGLAWGLMLASGGAAVAAPSLAHMVVQCALALAFAAYLPNRGTPDAEADFEPVALFTVVAYTALAIVALASALGAGAFGGFWQVCVLATAALFTACGVGAAPAIGALAGGAVVILAALRLWPAEAGPPLIQSGYEFYMDWRQPRDLTLYAFMAGAMSLGCAIVAAGRVYLGPALRLPMASVPLAVANLLPLGALGVIFLRFTRGDASPAMAAIAAALAALFVGAARAFRAHPGIAESRALQLGFGAFASGAIAALSLGLVFFLQGGALTVALGLAALGAAYVGHRVDAPALRWCVCGLGVLVAARFAWDPRIVGPALGATPVFNWLLFGYGVPAVAFAVAGRIMLRDADDIPARVADGCAVLFAALLVFFEIRHGLNGGDPLAVRSSLAEQGLMALSAFGFSIVLLRLDARRANVVFGAASAIAGLIGLATSAIALLVFSNPYFNSREIEGGTFYNTLLLGYVLPGVAAFTLARQARAYHRPILGSAAGVATIAFLFVYASLQTRRMFHDDGDVGFLRGASDAEFYAYSIVWLLLGVLLLGYGLWARPKEARIASAAFVVLTVLKVFFFDLRGLEGILRALSFIGLGVALIGIGLVYQKWIFARPTASANSNEEGPSVPV